MESDKKVFLSRGKQLSAAMPQKWLGSSGRVNVVRTRKSDGCFETVGENTYCF